MKTTIFIGGYTTPEKCGLHMVSVDTEKKTISPISVVPRIGNPIYFAINKAKTRLYVTEGATPSSGRAMQGTLAAYALNEDLFPTLISQKTFDFSVPCHIFLSANEDKLFFAEYLSAHLGQIEIAQDGTFVENSEVVWQNTSPTGPNKPRQDAPHCHSSVPCPDGTKLFVCDLGTDEIKAYDLTRPGLTPLPDCDLKTPPGFGPRHLTFSPGGTIGYVVYELSSKVQALGFTQNGTLSPLQEPLSMLPEDFTGETKAAALRISPDGKWLLASNRGHNSIAAFKIQDDGTLSPRPVISPLTGAFPRDFDFVSNTDLVIVGHKLSDNVRLYQFDAATGTLSPLDALYQMEKPLAFIQ